MLELTRKEKDKALLFFQKAQTNLCQAFEGIDGCKKFETSCWDRKDNGGGGWMKVLRSQVIEKSGVNVSSVIRLIMVNNTTLVSVNNLFIGSVGDLVITC